MGTCVIAATTEVAFGKSLLGFAAAGVFVLKLKRLQRCRLGSNVDFILRILLNQLLFTPYVKRKSIKFELQGLSYLFLTV